MNLTPCIQSVFFDWNPLYKEDFRNLPKGEDPLYHRAEGEICKFARFTAPESKIKILFLRGNNLDDTDIKQICQNLKENHNLKVLDVSYNNITKESIETFRDLTELNKTLEFIGLAKNNLSMDDLKPFLD